MTTTDKFQYKAFAAKLSDFRASLNADEQELLDEMVTSTDVEAHARFSGRAALMKEGDDVEAHAMKAEKIVAKVSTEKAYAATEGDDVEAHAVKIEGRVAVMKEGEGEDVEAHAMKAEKIVAKVSTEKAYAATEGEDVEAHAKVAGKVVAKVLFKFNAARASYEIGDDAGEDVEAHAKMPRVSDAARS